jgi:enoyl-CoA hydratase
MSAEPPVILEREEPIALVTLNREKQLNALSAELMTQLVEILTELDADEQIRAIVLTGSERAFAAGADIADLSDSTPVDLHRSGHLERWDRIGRLRTPIVAAVAGYCLGGGLELAMACATVVAAEGARFGQPETALGLLPGAGGTQRLVRAVGKAVAMDLILTGRMLTADEALAAGLAARVVEPERLLGEAREVARAIAERGPVGIRLAKEAVDQAFETPLAAGIDYERRNFYIALASEDAGEGLKAFLEKRKAEFEGR